VNQPLNPVLKAPIDRRHSVFDNKAEKKPRQRAEEFGLPFPSRMSVKALSAAERLAKLESVLAAVIREQANICESNGIVPHPDLLEFANSLR